MACKVTRCCVKSLPNQVGNLPETLASRPFISFFPSFFLPSVLLRSSLSLHYANRQTQSLPELGAAEWTVSPEYMRYNLLTCPFYVQGNPVIGFLPASLASFHLICIQYRPLGCFCFFAVDVWFFGQAWLAPKITLVRRGVVRKAGQAVETDSGSGSTRD